MLIEQGQPRPSTPLARTAWAPRRMCKGIDGRHRPLYHEGAFPILALPRGCG